MSEDAWKTILLKLAFPDLTDQLLDFLGAATQVETYPAETILCREGERGDTFYIIEDGEVAFTLWMEGDDHHFLRLGERGDFFGEMALLDEDYVRSASVITTQPTTVLEIDRSSFARLINDAPSLALMVAKMIGKRMRENDRAALAEMETKKREIEIAYEALQRVDDQRHEFLNTMAHEIRTPLTSVMGYMQ